MLDSSPPAMVIVRDTEGNSARVQITYPRLPPKCLNCGRFGHLMNRCPQPMQKNPPPKKVIATSVPIVALDTSISITTGGPTSPKVKEASVEEVVQVKIQRASKKTVARARSRSRAKKNSRALSTPPIITHITSSPSSTEEKDPVSKDLSIGTEKKTHSTATSPPSTAISKSEQHNLLPSDPKMLSSLPIAVQIVLSDIDFPSNSARKTAKKLLMAAFKSQSPDDIFAQSTVPASGGIPSRDSTAC